MSGCRAEKGEAAARLKPAGPGAWPRDHARGGGIRNRERHGMGEGGPAPAVRSGRTPRSAPGLPSRRLPGFRPGVRRRSSADRKSPRRREGEEGGGPDSESALGAGSSHHVVPGRTPAVPSPAAFRLFDPEPSRTRGRRGSEDAARVKGARVQAGQPVGEIKQPPRSEIEDGRAKCTVLRPAARGGARARSKSQGRREDAACPGPRGAAGPGPRELPRAASFFKTPRG
jgi:hypothetical protein